MMLETLKQVIEYSTEAVSIFGENTKFKYEERISNTQHINVELLIIETQPKSRVIFRKFYTIVDKEDKLDFKLDLIRAEFLREVLGYAFKSAQINLDKVKL